MLYPTHKKYGILWGLLMIPVAVSIGFIPMISAEMRNGDLMLILLTIYMGMRGALFGARFPDVDSASSIPAKRHPILRKIFVRFGVKHRGKYSHDYFWIAVTFATVYILIKYCGTFVLNILAQGSNPMNLIVYLGGMVFIYIIGIDIVEFFQWVANVQKNKKMWAILEKHQFKLAFINVAIMFTVLLFSGFIDIKSIITGQVSVGSAVTILTMLIITSKVYVLFAWAGAFSHLFADMSTKTGVSIFGIKLAPAQVILKVKKIPLIGALLVPTEFRTGSKWEDFNNFVVTILCIPASILAILFLVGFNVKEVLKLLGMG